MTAGGCCVVNAVSGPLSEERASSICSQETILG